MTNDRLRFRAWHRPTKRLFEVWCYTPEYVFENSETDGVYASPTNPARTDDCVLEQCTGVRDEKGSLVYEGDIILVRWRNPLLAEIRYNDDEARFVAMTDVERFGIDDLRSPFVILGNIHDNKGHGWRRNETT